MKKTVRGLLHGSEYDVLIPAEQFLWKLYYSLEPFDGEIKYLAEIEAGIKRFMRPHYPPECDDDQPLINQNFDEMNKAVAEQFTELARKALKEEGFDLDQMLKDLNK